MAGLGWAGRTSGGALPCRREGECSSGRLGEVVVGGSSDGGAQARVAVAGLRPVGEQVGAAGTLGNCNVWGGGSSITCLCT